jgi:hypothetical protein
MVINIIKLEYLKKIEELTLKDSSIYKYFSIDYNDE